MKILIPLDGSPVAEAALPKALELAKRSDGARLFLVRAVEPKTLPGGFAAAPMAAINEAVEYLRHVAAQLESEGAELVWRSVRYAAAGTAIVDAARAVKPDILVMVSNGAPGRVPGSIAEFVRQRAGIPIVSVPTRKAPTEASAVRVGGRDAQGVRA